MFQFVRLFLTILTLCLFIPTRVSAEVAPADPVAVQLYVFGEPASQPAEPLKEVLDTVREAGYSQIQAWLDYYKTEESAKTLQALLDEYGIKMVAAYTGGNMHEADKAEAAIETIPPRLARTLEGLDGLTPGDFANVVRQRTLLGESLSPEDFLRRLMQECRWKAAGGLHPAAA